jgi:hypothetical protein
MEENSYYVSIMENAAVRVVNTIASTKKKSTV